MNITNLWVKENIWLMPIIENNNRVNEYDEKFDKHHIDEDIVVERTRSFTSAYVR